MPSNRLVFVDVYKGITMFLLIAEAAGLYHALDRYAPGPGIGHWIVQQFHHHPWNGLRFWDLIQPFFMFIVGVVMPFSMKSRLNKGHKRSAIFRHMVNRCLILFLLGTGLHCVYNRQLVWELWNVLTQLSFTIFVTFLLMRYTFRTQAFAFFGFLMLTEILYRIYNPETPFVKDQNFGSWMDMVLMGKINDGGGWVAINIIPTAAHTILGAMCGKVLLSATAPMQRIKYFVLAGLGALLIGYGLDWLALTPIVKRIATTSFVLASSGWCLLTLAFFYWFVDIKGYKKWAPFFTIVAMNSIFIYMFSETIGRQWLGDFGMIWTFGLFGLVGISAPLLGVINAIFVLAILWYLCYFLYKNNVFIKI